MRTSHLQQIWCNRLRQVRANTWCTFPVGQCQMQSLLAAKQAAPALRASFVSAVQKFKDHLKLCKGAGAKSYCNALGVCARSGCSAKRSPPIVTDVSHWPRWSPKPGHAKK